jgi:hypothetical protein
VKDETTFFGRYHHVAGTELEDRNFRNFRKMRKSEIAISKIKVGLEGLYRPLCVLKS